MRIPAFKDSKEAGIDVDRSQPDFMRALQRIPPENEQAVVEDVQDWYKKAQMSRMLLEWDWLLSRGFYLGHQWMDFNPGTAAIEPLFDHASLEERASHTTVNLIEESMELVCAAVTQNRPDVSFSGLTSREIDQAAAKEARAINDHCDREFCDEQQLRDMVNNALTSTTCFLYQYWDPDKKEWVPTFDNQGNITGMKKLPVGGIREEIVPCWYIYPDPKAKSWAHCGRLCHVLIRDQNELIDEYGDVAKGVEPDTYSTPAGFIESRLDWLNRDFGQSTFNTIKNAVTVYSVWDRPGYSKRFPKGRHIVVAGNKVLRYEEWPYDDDQFPFLPLGFLNVDHTLWARNNVSKVRDLQIKYNRVYSRIMNRLQNDKLTLLMQRGAESGPDAYEGDEQKEVIYYNLGAQQPAFQAPPPINPEWFTYLAAIKTDLQEMTGARDVSRGIIPNGVTAAQAIQMLQAANASQLSGFLGNIERWVECRAQRRGDLYAQFARGIPQLMGINEMGDYAQNMESVMAFRALRGGGKTRCIVTPGSAKPNSPDAQNERIMEWFKAGMFGPIVDPMSAIAAWKAMDHSKADQVVEYLIQMRQQMLQEQQAQAQQQPNPAMINAQAKLAEHVSNVQHEAQLKALEHQHEIDLENTKHQNAMEELRLKQGHEIRLLGAKQGHDAEMAAIEHHNDSLAPSVEPEPNEGALNVSVAFKANLPGDAASEVLQQHGIPSDPAKAEAVNQPPPAPAAQKKTGETNGN
ncbi:MAG TPA: hypothetical protein VJQ82_17240 [Terriglobales bacterium]|nr:hypothetical protein [Terriglobales bacterium]